MKRLSLFLIALSLLLCACSQAPANETETAESVAVSVTDEATPDEPEATVPETTMPEATEGEGWRFDNGLLTLTANDYSVPEELRPYVTELEITDSVMHLMRSGLAGCQMAEVVIPAGVSLCPTSAFDGCPLLKDITFLNPCCAVVGDVEGKHTEFETATVHGYKDSTALDFVDWHQIDFAPIDYEPVEWSLEDGTLTVSAKGAMEEFGFAHAPWRDKYKQITRIVVEEGTAGISRFAFSGFENVTELILPESLRYIANSAFGGCSGLTEIALPDGVAVIEEDAFGECLGLTEFTIPAGALSGRIRGGAFNSCANLAEFKNRSDHYFVEDGVLFDTQALASQPNGCTLTAFPRAKAGAYVVPENVEYIARMAFAGTHYLTSVTLPSHLTSIDSYAFMYCLRLKEVVFPERVESIGMCAFADCALTDVTLKEVGTLDLDAFYGLNSLTIECRDYELRGESKDGMAIVVISPEGSALEDWAVENDRSFIIYE